MSSRSVYDLTELPHCFAAAIDQQKRARFFYIKGMTTMPRRTIKTNSSKMSPTRPNDSIFALVIKTSGKVGWFRLTCQRTRLDESDAYLAVFLLFRATRASYWALTLFRRCVSTISYVQAMWKWEKYIAILRNFKFYWNI